MLPCKEIARMIASDEQLPLMRRVELRLHLWICKYCSRYYRHIRILNEVYCKLLQREVEVDPKEVKRLQETVLAKLDVG